jgi:outer membrane protein W
MKKLFGIALLVVLMQTAYAQRAGGFRFQMDLGTAIPKNGGIGGLLNLEPQILVRDNLAVGLRFGFASLAKNVTYYNLSNDFDGEISANASVAGTVNYYLNNGNSRVAPYIGAGFGYFALSNLNIESTSIDPDNVGNLEADFAWAPMIRAGFELGKFRLGAEYNFIPNSSLQNLNGAVIGEAINEYFGFTLGFFVGGGKWGK